MSVAVAGSVRSLSIDWHFTTIHYSQASIEGVKGALFASDSLCTGTLHFLFLDLSLQKE